MLDNMEESKDRYLSTLRESDKIYFDFFKHLTTLNSGAILILIAFIEKVFDYPKPTWLLILLFVFFILSLISSTLMMLFIAKDWQDKSSKESLQICLHIYKIIRGMAFYVSMIGFLFGFILIIVFAFKNF